MASDFEIESSLLDFVAGFSGRLAEQDIVNATELISKREWGVGLEILCAQLAENDIELDPMETIALKALAEKLEMDISAFWPID